MTRIPFLPSWKRILGPVRAGCSSSQRYLPRPKLGFRPLARGRGSNALLFETRPEKICLAKFKVLGRHFMVTKKPLFVFQNNFDTIFYLVP